eukprot:m.106832 g.106832  ORF g.106832 m.106832 type:complete len:182 (-) comp13310_c2_seq1:5270-5815(-)
MLCCTCAETNACMHSQIDGDVIMVNLMERIIDVLALPFGGSLNSTINNHSECVCERESEHEIMHEEEREGRQVSLKITTKRDVLHCTILRQLMQQLLLILVASCLSWLLLLLLLLLPSRLQSRARLQRVSLLEGSQAHLPKSLYPFLSCLVQELQLDKATQHHLHLCPRDSGLSCSLSCPP